jgi:RNA polymerase sigma factor (sigma-70 family)
MTATLNGNAVSPSDSDGELARASAAGDERAFAGIYHRYANRLHDFCVGMLADRDSAADCVQDVFCTAATQLPQLRDPDKLRPWLYSIARNEALRRIRARRRETPLDEVPDAASGDAGPDTLAARLELAELIADAADGLSDRDRAVLDLAFRHGLSGPELADVLGVTLINANTMVHRLRETIERSLGALLVSRRVRNTGGCPELSAILQGWDGSLNVLMRKRISRHIESCDTCDEERRRLVSPTALLGGAPVFIPAPSWLRERTLSQVELTSSATSMGGGPVREDRATTGTGPSARGMLLPFIGFVVAVIAAMGSTLIWASLQSTTSETPIEVGVVAEPLPLPASVEPPSLVSVEPVVPSPPPAPPRRTTTVAPPPASTPPAPPPAPPLPSALPPPLPAWPQLPPLLQWPQWPGVDPGGSPRQPVEPRPSANP